LRGLEVDTGLTILARVALAGRSSLANEQSKAQAEMAVEDTDGPIVVEEGRLDASCLSALPWVLLAA
jgi:hypothetical protein